MHSSRYVARVVFSLQMTLLVALCVTTSPREVRSAGNSQYDACMQRSGGVTDQMLACILAATDEAEAAIDLALGDAFRKLGESSRSTLGDVQSDWERFRKSTCDYEASLAGDGSFTSVALADCWLRLTRERLAWIDANVSRKE